MAYLNRIVVLTSLMACGLATACGPGGGAPEVDPIGDQVAKVGVELVIAIRATDPDGDDLSYSFDANVPDIHARAQMTKRPDGSGLFKWTPQASDVNADGWLFDFTASDGDGEDTITIRIVVKSEVGQAGAPIFREPLGTGTTLDLSADDCVQVNIVIEDADSSSVVLSAEEPTIEGSSLDAAPDGLSGTWSWCPSARQIEDDDRYMLTLSADDLTNEKTTKNYLIVLRKPPKPDCPGEPPVISHSPSDESTVVSLLIFVDITDDQGLKAEPLFYYSQTAPANPPNLGSMTQLTMELIDGTMANGTWGVDVPNPVASMPSGSSASLYYVVVAADNDDLEGSCDHITQAPSSGSYSMTVTNPGGGGGAGVCEPCTADIQCGDAGDLCVRVGPMADSYCMQSCSGPSDCPTDYVCSTDPVTSIGGTSARQCVPNSGNCDDPGGGVCLDDSFEDNDSRAEADAKPPLTPGTKNLVSCEAGPYSDDEDFFRIVLTGDTQVDISVAGGSASDLDLQLQDASGTTIESSVSLTSNESVSQCLTAGTYYVRVYAYGAEENPYTLTYTAASTTCGGAACDDDEFEDDDNLSQARTTNIYPDPFVSETNAICAEDDDWFEVELFDGEKVVVDLTFEQTSSSEDLDLHFHNAAGTDLTPCAEADPATCSTAQGQSGSSNEHFEYTVADASCSTGCLFYVVVHGWNGSENLYDIQITLVP